jgi:AcrR family transcriptional regulator
MAKGGTRSRIGRGTVSGGTRQRLVEAAFETLRTEGFVHASARTIAGRGGLNPALIFYYFDSVNDLLLQALAWSSRRQLAAYEETLASARTLPEVVAAVQERLGDDMDSGHVKVLVELVGASSTDPAFSRAVVDQVEPWLELTEQTLGRVLDESGLSSVAPRREMAFGIVSMFLGMELLTGVLGNRELVNGLFGAAGRVAVLVKSLSGSPTSKGRGS